MRGQLLGRRPFRKALELFDWGIDMTLLRKQQKSHFAHISNDVLQDHRLSFKARGVAAYLLSLPDDWHVTIKSIARHGTEGQDAVRTALAELAEYGYMTRDREHGDGGAIRTITIISDHAAFIDLGTPEERLAGYSNSDRPPDYPRVGSSEGRKTDLSVNGGSYKDYRHTTKKTNKEKETPRAAVTANGLSLQQLYEAEIGPLTPMILDSIEEWSAKVPPIWIREAIEIAVGMNKRSWSYVQGIIRNSEAEGKSPKQRSSESQNYAPAGRSDNHYEIPDDLRDIIIG